jgi:hypothetical protein
MPLLIVALLGGSAAGMLLSVNQLTLRQAIAPVRLQGRMNATVRFMYWSPGAAGFAIGGGLASLIGLRSALWVSVAGSAAAMLPLAFTSIRRLRVLPELEQETAAAAVAYGDA